MNNLRNNTNMTPQGYIPSTIISWFVYLGADIPTWRKKSVKNGDFFS